jgi:predicted phage terminase large subunit-like protein
LLIGSLDNQLSSQRSKARANQLGSPSLGRKRDEQHTGKLSDALRDLPCGSPQVERVTVYGEDPESGVEVFDFQVEGTSNFFAEQILVHNCLIIDDPVKNDKQALSPAFRNGLWDWWQSTAESRLEPGGVAIVMATRWHHEDLSGRLLEQARKGDRPPVIHLHLPAIAEDDDVLGREPGEALWPERWPIIDLERKRKSSDPYWWNALYQGRPTRSGKMRFPDEYFDSVFVDEIPDEFDWRVMAIDPAQGKDMKRGDYSAVVWVGAAGGKLYVESLIGRWPVRQMCETAVGLARQMRPELVSVEANAWQHLLAGEIDRVCAAKQIAPLPIKLVHNTIAKETRIDRLGGLLSRGLIKFRPTQSNRMLVDQLKQFPHGDHDDGPDALEMAYRLLQWMIDAEDRDQAIEVIR